MKIEVTFEGTDVKLLALHVNMKPNEGPPDVLRLGDGALYVLVGKPLDGRKLHFTYRKPKVEDIPYLFETVEGGIDNGE